MKVRALVLILALGSAVQLATAREKPLQYPKTKKGDVVDTLWGVKVADPYRWLEDDVRKSKDVADWVEAQNAVTFAYLKALPERETIRKRLTELWNYERFGVPFKAGKRYFFSKNDGLQNQSVLYLADGPDGKPAVLLDPNRWSKDGTVALSGIAVSEDGKYLAHGIAEAGSDWNSWKILDVESGKLLEDHLRWIKFSPISWTRDSKGFFYCRFDEPREGAFTGLNLNQKVFYHRVGTRQSEDELIFSNPKEPRWIFGHDVSEDGKHLVLTARQGTDARVRVFWKDLTDPKSKIVELVDNFQNNYDFLGNDGSVLYFFSDLKAPLGRVLAIDVQKPGKDNWKEIIPQRKETLRGVSLVGGHFICNYLKDAYTQVRIHKKDGTHVRDVSFPGIGTASGFSGRADDSETFYAFSSFATPPSIYRYDVATGKSTLWKKSATRADTDSYEVKQVFIKSKDGTRVPMFITARKGFKPTGDAPVLLYGYGGFNIPLTPQFSIARLAWLEMGGVFCVANLRGGGEYGKEWHKAGTKLKKQNVFDDFIAAAEWLIENRYTNPRKLAIEGRSNGGLLVGACMTQRPELFGACLPGVGVMDMLRFQKFTAGRFWVDDYGSAEASEAEFKALYAYSPYHNLKPGTKYPATLVTTADTDDRVVPGHSFKFAARLQECQAGDAPVLIRIETRAGHGAGKPTAKIIEETADEYVFLVKNLGMQKR